MSDPNPGDILSGEPAQSKRTWTFLKSNFVWKFTRKMPDALETTSIADRALTLTIRTPQCGHIAWGMKKGSTAMAVVEFSVLNYCLLLFLKEGV